jgi:hypothetical protein
MVIDRVDGKIYETILTKSWVANWWLAWLYLLEELGSPGI